MSITALPGARSAPTRPSPTQPPGSAEPRHGDLPTRPPLRTRPSNFSLPTPCLPSVPRWSDRTRQPRATLRVVPTPGTIASIRSIRSIRSTRVPKPHTPTHPLIHSAPPFTPATRPGSTRSRIPSNHPLPTAPSAARSLHAAHLRKSRPPAAPPHTRRPPPRIPPLLPIPHRETGLASHLDHHQCQSNMGSRCQFSWCGYCEREAVISIESQSVGSQGHPTERPVCKWIFHQI